MDISSWIPFTFDNEVTVGDVILLITAVIVYWYTKAAQKTNELQERPVLHLYFEERQNNGGARLGNVFIKNIGKGIAHDIKIRPIRVYQENRGECVTTFYLDYPILEPDKQEKLKTVTRLPDNGTEGNDRDLMWFIVRAIPDTLHQAEHSRLRKKYPAVFLVTYKNVNGESYYSIFDFYSTVTAVGDILLQLVGYGKGKISYWRAKHYALKNKRIESPFAHRYFLSEIINHKIDKYTVGIKRWVEKVINYFSS